jgi:hypothetical protein
MELKSEPHFGLSHMRNEDVTGNEEYDRDCAEEREASRPPRSRLIGTFHLEILDA